MNTSNATRLPYRFLLELIRPSLPRSLLYPSPDLLS